jgi:uncharacterized protein
MPGTQGALPFRLSSRFAPVSRNRILAFLGCPTSYPDHPDTIECIETHMSWVFLSGEFAYKMKKPVVLPHLDFSTLDRRLANCQEEVRLNRLLAPGVYLGVTAVCHSREQGLAIGLDGEPLEWLVWMRRLPRELMLDQALAADCVETADLHRCARVLAAFYRQRPPAIDCPEGYLKKLHQAIEEDVEGLANPRYRLRSAMFRQAAETLLDCLASRRAWFEDRVHNGHVVEGHGDLRPEHVCLTRPPVFIDCLEFSRDLRILDVADELAYLFLECECLGSGRVEHELGGEYRKVSGDPLPKSLLDFHKSRRALLRARLCLAHLLDRPSQRTEQHWRDRAADYLVRAARHADSLNRRDTK